MEPIHKTIKDAYKEFMEQKKIENLSSSTLATYKLHIDNFIASDNLSDLSTLILNQDLYFWWIEDMREEGRKKDVTITSYCRSVRAFLYWLQDNDYCSTFHMPLPKYQKEIKETYTNEELAVLLKKPDENTCSQVEYQTWVFINLIIATGLRLSSALGIRVGSYVPTEKMIYIQTTKNKKAQMAYLNDDICRILNQYIKKFDLQKNDAMFCTAEGTQLAKRTMQDNVATYNRKLGVSKTSIHLFRHTFAKNFYEQTKDIYTLRTLLGHSSISVTENYLQDLGVRLENATAYNPQQEYAQTSNKKVRRGKMK